MIIFIPRQDAQGARTISLPDYEVNMLTPSEKPEAKHVFSLSHSQHALLFSAPDVEVMDRWVELLSHAAKGEALETSLSVTEHRKSRWEQGIEATELFTWIHIHQHFFLTKFLVLLYYFTCSFHISTGQNASVHIHMHCSNFSATVVLVCGWFPNALFHFITKKILYCNR